MSPVQDVVPGRHPDPGDAHLLHERYRASRGRASSLRLFYRVKPFVPRTLQVTARRVAARRQRRTRFPSWPCEPALVRRRARALRAHLATTGAERLPIVNLWPGRARFAVVLTHDVESPAGLQRLPRLLEVEREFDLVSSWNLCADWYPVDRRDLDVIRSAGCEVGVHGVKHDGRLFDSRATWCANLPEIRAALQAWSAVGFRSPALRRNAAWMHELPCSYDSSFPDTEPFGPQGGGCCAIHPFFFGDVVELPITLTQDFFLFDLLRERDIEHWTRKARWLMRHHGLITVLVHPDYCDEERLGQYRALLAFLREAGGWHALPRDVALWWRARDAMRCVVGEDGEPRVEGEQTERAAVAWVRERDDEIVYEL